MVSAYQFGPQASLKIVITFRDVDFQGCLMCSITPVILQSIMHIPVPLDTPALNDTQNNHDNRDNQQNVNESADCVRGNQPQYPEDDQDDCNTFKHVCFSVRGRQLTAIKTRDKQMKYYRRSKRCLPINR